MPMRLAPLPAGRWITISDGPGSDPPPRLLGDSVPEINPR